MADLFKKRSRSPEPDFKAGRSKLDATCGLQLLDLPADLLRSLFHPRYGLDRCMQLVARGVCRKLRVLLPEMVPGEGPLPASPLAVDTRIWRVCCF
jgi:hypothetical protein